MDQALQFEPDVVLDEEMRDLERDDDHFVLRCRLGEYRSRAVVIAGGKGAFEPMTLSCPGFERLMHRGVEFSVRDPEVFRDKRVMVVGGGDSALDFVLMLKDVSASISLVHRRDAWRAHAATVQRIEAAEAASEIKVRAFHEVREVHGSDHVNRVTIFENRNDDHSLHQQRPPNIPLPQR